MKRDYPKRHWPSGGTLRRHVSSGKGKWKKKPIRLTDDHPAIVESRSLFPSTVVPAQDAPRVLISGHNSRKIGKRVTMGKWKGLPIYTLTLEERATCPRSCRQWSNCYGNAMHLARRHEAGAALELRLIGECVELERQHPQGFAVRLHVLGDFYSKPYAELWGIIMRHVPGMHLFGFTARDALGDIGAAVMRLNKAFPDRCRIRFSGRTRGPLGSIVVTPRQKVPPSAIVCPNQRPGVKSDGKTPIICANCGLCWTSDRTIAFLEH